MNTVRVDLGRRSYNIVIGRGILGRCGKLIEKAGTGNDAVIVTNSRLRRLYGSKLARSLKGSGFTVRFESVPDSERAKSVEVATNLINRISSYDIGKRIFVIAFGGGVIGDLAGFVASVYKRGIPYIQIPTTLLAQVDSAIGGKVAVDLPVAKNLIGTFHQPKIVISDVSLLVSLTPRQLRSGLAEAVKYGIIKDAGLFRFIKENCGMVLRRDLAALERIVTRCARIKAGVVSRDELDRKGFRAILNYGHTIGHAIEAASEYSGRYSHGEAIAIGMLAAADVSRSLGILKGSEAEEIEALVTRLGLPTTAKGLCPADVYASHLHDKKFTGETNRFILATRIGAVKVASNVPDRAIRDALKERISS